MDSQDSRISARRRGSYDASATSVRPHFKILAQRRRSAPSLVFGKSLPWSPISEETPCRVSAEQSPFVHGLTSENGPLLLDECVQVTEGIKTRERHLFLFCDVVIFAKLRSPYSYRLKHRVDLSDMYLQGLEEDFDDEELPWGDVDTQVTLIMAWPFTFCLVCFSSPEVKERWFETLSSKINLAKTRVGSSIPPAVLMKVLSSSLINKEESGGGMEQFIQSAIECDAKMPPLSKHNQEDKPAQMIENKWNLVRRLRKGASFASRAGSTDRKTHLFGLPLHKICPGDCSPPKPVTEMLLLLRKRGPATEGVFRKPCNSKNMRDIREKLNSGQEVDLEAQPVVLLVGLLKSFLKELPGSLLVSELYNEWIITLDIEDIQQKAVALKLLVERLPSCNKVLLQHLLCLLHHILENADLNKMDAVNLAICIGPTLLQLNDTPLEEQKEKMGKVTELTQFLIEHVEMLGENILNLLDTDEDSLCSQHPDSAYDSTDPDGEAGESSSHDGSSSSPSFRPDPSTRDSWPSDTVFDPKPIFARRCSEPIIAHLAFGESLSRSHDDFSVERQHEKPLTKPVSDDSLLVTRRSDQALPFTTSGRLVSAEIRDCSCSSLESAVSNQSEESVFTSSPAGSPTCTKRKTLSEHFPKINQDAKISSQSVSTVTKVLMRTRSLGRFSRNSLRKEPQNSFPCETLQEDSQCEVEPAVEQRLRPLSAITVFRQVDSQLACSPPSYQQAVHNVPPQYGSMTVHEAIKLERRSRPSSLNFPSTCVTPCDPQVVVGGQAFRQRAMSESVSANHHETVTRRCSQPVFEEFSYAKESYV